ncbi:MAG TPA: glycosyltransferase family 9 protein [Ktedonobacterales bacterium]|nr:glycosyltransferase family 9 protein [Ktedonobacterales bacterium]
MSPASPQGSLRHLPVSPPVERIAILRALQLGDLLLTVPALRAIRARFPAAEITLIGLPWAAELAQRLSRYVDRFVEFPGYPGIAEASYDEERTARFFARQCAYGYDLAIQMHGNGTASNGFCRALGARMTVGCYDDTPPDGLTLGAPYPRDAHEIERNLAIARLLGCRPPSLDLEFPLRSADTAEAARLLRRLARAPRPWIGLHPGARASSRRWPAESFARAGVLLARRFGATLILTGGTDERETASSVAALLRTRTGVLRTPPPVDAHACAPPSPRRERESRGEVLLNLAGRTSLGGLAAVIARLDLYISNDTGPAHLADAVGTPSITLFGPADHRRWAPLDARLHPILREPVSCSPCAFAVCPIDHRCLRRIGPEQVIEQAARLLETSVAACDA